MKLLEYLSGLVDFNRISICKTSTLPTANFTEWITQKNRIKDFQPQLIKSNNFFVQFEVRYNMLFNRYNYNNLQKQGSKLLPSKINLVCCPLYPQSRYREKGGDVTKI